MPVRLSPSSLNQFLGCEQRTYLDLLHQQGALDAEPLQPDARLLLERGDRHEERVLGRMRGEGRTVTAIARTGPVEERAAATDHALHAGADVVHQACLTTPGWVGYADFLIKVAGVDSDLGNYAYEVHDAKLGSHPLPDHLFQLMYYNDRLAEMQGHRPRRVHLILGDDTTLSFDPGDYDAYDTRIRAAFLARRRQLGEAVPAPPVDYPYPVEDCDFCRWWKHCADRRREEDHLSLVAGLTRPQGLKLEAGEITTLRSLAGLADDVEILRLSRETLGTLRAQADLQLRSRGLAVPLHELLEPEHERGLARLPELSAGDVFFDFEGDPWWGDSGIEYLFGTVAYDDGAWSYRGRWATSQADERQVFEEWMTWITERLARFPDLHVFHYNSYEPTALKRLMARHATKVHEVDELLRRKVLVDLYGVVRQGLRAGVDSYSLKALEPLVGFARTHAAGSLRRWQEFQDTGDKTLLADIAAYNEDDCRSTQALRDWLMDRRPEAEAQYGRAIASLAAESVREPSDRMRAYRERVEQAREWLMTGLPEDEDALTDDQRAMRLAFDLTSYHEREAKPAWWSHFARMEADDHDLRENDTEAIAGLVPLGERRDDGSAWVWDMTFPAQQHKLAVGDVWDRAADCGVRIMAFDDVARSLTVRRSKRTGDDAPIALVPRWPIPTDAQVDAVLRFARRIHEHGLGPCGSFDAATDLLLRRPPRLVVGTPPMTAGPTDGDKLAQQVIGLDRSALVIQGPPGTGKTHTGAHLAVSLMAEGKTVGVMATSHKAIVNLLEKIDEVAGSGPGFRGWKKAAAEDPESNDYTSDRVTSSAKPPKNVKLDLVAGTSWLWAREERFEGVDVLLVDEAGQVSLADAIAVSQGAKSVVLLGDPQQLAHVSQGLHLHGSGVSILQHLLGDRHTVDEGAGVLLRKSYRMHPDVCGFISRTMYDNKLESDGDCARQRIDANGLSGTGLRLLELDHVENRQTSDEEAEAIAAEIRQLLNGGQFMDKDGAGRRLTLEDMLVVAPYNAQVRRLRSKLPSGARVGTVDKFQGQQAPVVFFSMTSSSGDEVPRGMDFLFSANRLNVAISRAQALAVVVCSPRLMVSRCSTIEQMRLVNLLCRFGDEAEPVKR
jgi:predicted RecB family nuclease